MSVLLLSDVVNILPPVSTLSMLPSANIVAWIYSTFGLMNTFHFVSFWSLSRIMPFVFFSVLKLLSIVILPSMTMSVSQLELPDRVTSPCL
jgi:hypothetical protein